jgi:hypothetical protein
MSACHRERCNGLAELHTSIQRLLRQVLRESTDEQLAHGRLSQAEIALLLGYSEESAFSLEQLELALGQVQICKTSEPGH